MVLLIEIEDYEFENKLVLVILLSVKTLYPIFPCNYHLLNYVVSLSCVQKIGHFSMLPIFKKSDSEPSVKYVSFYIYKPESKQLKFKLQIGNHLFSS